MQSPCPSELTVSELLATLPEDSTLTQREIVLLDHLTAAVEEIDTLTRELKAAQAKNAVDDAAPAGQEDPHADP